MISHLQKFGDSWGIVLDEAILDRLQAGEDTVFEITLEKNGLFLKPLSMAEAYETIARKHGKSLEKLAR